MEFGMSRRIKPKEKYARISMKEIWRNLWRYVVSFEFRRPKVAQKPPLQPVPCEQVRCRQATGVWLKHITYTVSHKSKTPIIYRVFYVFNLHFKNICF